MRSKSLYFYIALFCIHSAIAMVAFLFFRLHPFNVIAANSGDGLKNIFTLLTYVREPIGPEGILKYNNFQYPFGDYVYYADNTPLFSIPFRWFCHHIYDASAYTIIVFYCVIILNIILCGLLVFYIFRKLLGQNVLPFIMAIVLPWANMQILRIFVGHYAFSFTSLILIAIVLMMQWHRHRDSRRRLMITGACMVLLSYLSFLAQGYYLAIITLFIAAMLFFYGLFFRKEAIGKFSMIASFVYGILGVGFTIGIIALTDRYLPLRREAAHGYDWTLQKTTFSSLFSHYPFHTVFFPISYGRIVMEPELAGYLGNIGLYAFLVIAICMVFSASFRANIIEVQRTFFRDPLKASILLGGLLMLFVAFGENYFTDLNPDTATHFTNLLNPLLYVHIFTNRVEQFRCMERFVWPFFFAFNIWMVYTVSVVYAQYGNKIKGLIIVAALYLGGSEVMNYVDACQSYIKADNPLAAKYIDQVKPKHIDARKYQAILPIPYYFIGSEDYSLTIDDNIWSTGTYLLSLGLNLPLMSCKMSRTPVAHNKMLLDFVAYDSMPRELLTRLSNKPVLVAVNERMLRDTVYGYIPCNPSPGLKEYCQSAKQFAVRNHLKAVDSMAEVVYYEWFPPIH